MSWQARLGTVAAFAAGAVFVSAAPWGFSFAAGLVRPVHHYRAVFDSVSGLTSGAPVERNGVEVGRVTAVDLTDDASPRVVVSLEVNHGVKVMGDSVASISGSILTGARSIEIVGGTAAAGRLHEGSQIRSDEAAPSAGDDLAIGNDQEMNIGARRGFLGRSRSALSEGSADFSQAGQTLRIVANNLSSPERWRSIDSTLANLNTASAHLSQTMERVDNVVDSFAARREQLYGQVDATLTRLNQTLDQANQLLATSNHLIKSSNEMISTTAIAIERNGGQIEQTLGEIDRTSHHLDETLQTIGPNPSTILWGSKREPQ